MTTTNGTKKTSTETTDVAYNFFCIFDSNVPVTIEAYKLENNRPLNVKC